MLKKIPSLSSCSPRSRVEDMILIKYLISVFRNSVTKKAIFLEAWKILAGLNVSQCHPAVGLCLSWNMSARWSVCTIDSSWKTPLAFSLRRGTAMEVFHWGKLSMFSSAITICKCGTVSPPLLSAFVDGAWCFHDNFGTPCLSSLNACLHPSLWGLPYLANHISHVYLFASEKQK